jgi:hypothetical protein
MKIIFDSTRIKPIAAMEFVCFGCVLWQFHHRNGLSETQQGQFGASNRVEVEAGD